MASKTRSNLNSHGLQVLYKNKNRSVSGGFGFYYFGNYHSLHSSFFIPKIIRSIHPKSFGLLTTTTFNCLAPLPMFLKISHLLKRVSPVNMSAMARTIISAFDENQHDMSTPMLNAAQNAPFKHSVRRIMYHPEK